MKDAVDTLQTVNSLASLLKIPLNDVTEIVNELQESGLVMALDSGDRHETLLFATMEGVELLHTTKQPLYTLDRGLLTEVRGRVDEVLRAETYHKLLKSITLGTATISAKMVVFAFFLLLTGAVNGNSALVVETNENSQELEYLDALAHHLDGVSRLIFPSSHAFKGAKGGKSFKAGQLDDTLRRRKELETAVGHDLFTYDDKMNSYRFNLYEGGAVKGDSLTALLKILVGRLREYAVGNEWESANLRRLVEEFQFKNPIPVAFRRFLFQGPPPDDWFFVFSYYLDEVLRSPDFAN